MGRRLIGGALVGIGLVVASLAWTGFSLSRTIFDPGRSVAVAEALYDDREVRSQLRASLATGLGAAIPDEVDVTRSELVAAADRALDDPLVEAAITDGLVRSHQRFLGLDPRPDEPIVVDGSAVAAAARSGLIATRPELMGVVPEIPSVLVTLPVDRLPDGGGAREWLNGAVVLLTALAVGLVAAAFVLTNDRPRVMRRVGYWAIGAGAFWLLVGVVLPQLAHLLVPGQAAIFAAIWGVAAGGMIGPATTAAVAGAVAVVLSFLWMAVNALLGRPGRRPADRPVPAAQPGAVPMSAPIPPGTPTAVHPAPAGPVPAPAPSPGGAPSADRTQVVGPAAAPAPSRPPRWREGVGYVDDDDSTLPG